ncbi:MAG: hypothetical protein A2W29_02220 [Gemmatimonadetes bacterium RBG_16_66_8]|nr:MAG: hypothetical protein A2W29_02220 [Gemmatimonadetes bacterium RBG_16_66_8]
MLARFLHMFGQALWIGGAIAAMVVALASREEDPLVRSGAFRLLARVHSLVIGPGVLLTVVTGLWLTMSYARQGKGAELADPGVATMQAFGLLGGLLALFVGLPTAATLARAAEPGPDGTMPPLFERLRKRQAIVSSIAGVMAVIALAGSRLF